MKFFKRVIIVIVVLIFLAVLYLNLPFSPEKKKFIASMEDRVNRTKKSNEVCTLEEIKQLPEPLQRYCNYIGLENFPKYKSVNVNFIKTNFVFDTKSGKVLSMDYDLWLFYDEIFRSAFCSSSMFGIPFEGVDYMTEDNSGGMKGVLAKKIKLFDVDDDQGYKAGLISWFAESVVINPSSILSPYVTYEAIDDSHVKATVSYNGVSGSGIITFNEEGAITEFYSDERQVEEIDGVTMKLGWKCYYEDYVERNGIKTITKVKSTKVFPDGSELVYFSSDNFSVTYLK